MKTFRNLSPALREDLERGLLEVRTVEGQVIWISGVGPDTLLTYLEADRNEKGTIRAHTISHNFEPDELTFMAEDFAKHLRRKGRD